MGAEGPAGLIHVQARKSAYTANEHEPTGIERSLSLGGSNRNARLDAKFDWLRAVNDSPHGVSISVGRSQEEPSPSFLATISQAHHAAR